MSVALIGDPDGPVGIFSTRPAKILIAWYLRLDDPRDHTQNLANKELRRKVFRNKDLGVVVPALTPEAMFSFINSQSIENK
jgi:hypothetical protein